ncbi:MAG: polyketide cyclase / dehydrase and lipid transport family protein [Acidimicrobiales bacterium]
MQDHSFDFVVEGTREDVWEVMWRQMRRDVATDSVAIEVYHPGDDTGNGLVRHCRFPVPRYLMSKGRGQSWEWITEAARPESWRYDAVGKPLWSRATGWTRLERVDDLHTRVHFRETYEAFNPLVRALLERRVHRFISKDNDRLIEASLHAMLRRLHDRR